LGLPSEARPPSNSYHGSSLADCPGARHHGYVDGSTSPVARPGWEKDAAVPRDLGELHGLLHGVVGLPIRLFGRARIPGRPDLSDPTRRRDLYEIVLAQGTLEDVRDLINGLELVRLWDQIYLPKRVARRGNRSSTLGGRQPRRMPLDLLQEKIAPGGNTSCSPASIARRVPSKDGSSSHQRS